MLNNNLLFSIHKYKILYIFYFLFACSDKKEAAIPEVSEMILDQYPMFVKISPNANKILLKSRGGNTFDLIIKNNENSKLDTIYKSNFTQLSLTWHPNDSEIVFQEFNPETRKYELYKVNLQTKKRSKLNLPSSSNAVPPIRFSKNGKYLAYISTNRTSTLYIYNFNRNKIHSSFSKLNSYSDFQWSGSSTIFFTESNKKAIVKEVDVFSRKIKEHILLKKGEIEKFVIKENKLLFIGRKHSEEFFQCYELDLNTKNLKKYTDNNFNITNCMYSKIGMYFYYNQNENGVDKLYCSDSLINNFVQNQFQGGVKIESMNSNSLYISNHSFNLPPNLIEINIEKLESRVLYKPNLTKDLSLLKPKFLILKRDNSNYEIPAFFWKKPSLNEQKTIIFIHGGPYGQSKPVWNDKVKIFTHYGFNYLTVNYQGSSGYSKTFAKYDELNQVLDIVSYIKFLKRNYNIHEKDIILIGSSYGGKIALKVIDYFDNLGGIVLISGLINNSINRLDRLKKIKLFGFYGEFDPLTLNAYKFFEKNKLLNSNDHKFKLLKNEGHIFHNSSSWIDIYSSIIK